MECVIFIYLFIYLLYFFDGQHRGMNSSSVTSEHVGAECEKSGTERVNVKL